MLKRPGLSAALPPWLQRLVFSASGSVFHTCWPAWLWKTAILRGLSQGDACVCTTTVLILKARALSVSTLDRDASPLRVVLEQVVAGEELAKLPGLEVEIGKLARIPIVEYAIQGCHATAKRKLRLNEHPSHA